MAVCITLLPSRSRPNSGYLDNIVVHGVHAVKSQHDNVMIAAFKPGPDDAIIGLERIARVNVRQSKAFEAFVWNGAYSVQSVEIEFVATSRFCEDQVRLKPWIA